MKIKKRDILRWYSTTVQNANILSLTFCLSAVLHLKKTQKAFPVIINPRRSVTLSGWHRPSGKLSGVALKCIFQYLQKGKTGHQMGHSNENDSTHEGIIARFMRTFVVDVFERFFGMFDQRHLKSYQNTKMSKSQRSQN